MADEFYQPREVFALDGLQVACGTMGMPTATVRLRGPDGAMHLQAAIGTGPVDAAYKAIDAIVQAPNTLLEFAVHAVTEGIDALGEVTVRIEGTNGHHSFDAQTRDGAQPHLWRPRRGHGHHRRQRQGLPGGAEQAARRHRQVWAGRDARHTRAGCVILEGIDHDCRF